MKPFLKAYLDEYGPIESMSPVMTERILQAIRNACEDVRDEDANRCIEVISDKETCSGGCHGADNIAIHSLKLPPDYEPKPEEIRV